MEWDSTFVPRRDGALRAEVSACAPLVYVYWRAGRRAGAGAGGVRALWASVRASGRLLAASTLHAHVVTPALCAALLTALRDGLDRRLVQGMVAGAAGGGRGWLALSVAARGESAPAAAAAALQYAAALLASPLLAALACGRWAAPSAWGVAHTLATAAGPFAAGAWRAGLRPGGGEGVGGGGEAVGEDGRGEGEGEVAARLCALALLYAECCERLSAAAGPLRLSDVLVTLALEAWLAGAVAASGALWARCGVLSRRDARLLTLCALPRLRPDAAGREACGSGLARLPGVFAAPAQALLVAALAPHRARPEAGADEEEDYLTHL